MGQAMLRVNDPIDSARRNGIRAFVKQVHIGTFEVNLRVQAVPRSTLFGCNYSFQSWNASPGLPILACDQPRVTASSRVSKWRRNGSCGSSFICLRATLRCIGTKCKALLFCVLQRNVKPRRPARHYFFRQQESTCRLHQLLR
jgi:hypothetical protein